MDISVGCMDVCKYATKLFGAWMVDSYVLRTARFSD